MKKVTGIGGIFFKCDDPEKMRDWYRDHLGLKTTEHGAAFAFKKYDQPDQTGYTAWNTFSAKTEYFKPSQKDFMFNYRVADLDALIEEFKANGVELVGEPQTFDYGKFAWIMDPEGNKIELWEPIDKSFDAFYTEDQKTF